MRKQILDEMENIALALETGRTDMERGTKRLQKLMGRMDPSELDEYRRMQEECRLYPQSSPLIYRRHGLTRLATLLEKGRRNEGNAKAEWLQNFMIRLQKETSFPFDSRGWLVLPADAPGYAALSASEKELTETLFEMMLTRSWELMYGKKPPYTLQTSLERLDISGLVDWNVQKNRKALKHIWPVLKTSGMAKNSPLAIEPAALEEGPVLVIKTLKEKKEG